MKSTKKSLVASGLSLLCYVVLLVGTTFAWFTDSVVNKGNKIQAGTLDIELEELRADGNYVTVGEKPIFDYDRWEPDYSDVAVLRVRNNGTLALKWNMQLIANGDTGELGDVIDVYAVVKEGAAITAIPGSLEQAISWGYTKIGTLNELMADPDSAAHGILYAANNKPTDGYSEAYAGIVLHMQEDAGNEYQGASIGTTFDIVLNATQYTYETDGFGSNKYDESAALPRVINSANYDSLIQAIEAAEEGDTVVLQESLTNTSVGISKSITLNLGGNTITSSDGQNGIVLSGNGTDVTIQATTGGVNLPNERCIRVNTQNADITVDGGSYSVEGTHNAYFMEDSSSGGSNSVTIQNVTYTGERGVQFSNSDNNNILIKDSTFTTTGYSGLFIGGNNNVCTLENVTFEGSQIFAADSSHTGDDGYSVIYIKSGTYKCKLNTSTGCTISITGGTFSSNPTQYLAEGYTAAKGDDGMWTVTEQ